MIKKRGVEIFRNLLLYSDNFRKLLPISNKNNFIRIFQISKLYLRAKLFNFKTLFKGENLWFIYKLFEKIRQKVYKGVLPFKNTFKGENLKKYKGGKIKR